MKNTIATFLLTLLASSFMIAVEAQSAVTLVWNSNAPSDSVTNYSTWNRVPQATNFNKLADVGLATNANISPSAFGWAYAVQAQNASGPSALSIPVTNFIPTAPAFLTLAGVIPTLTWPANPPAEGVTNYIVYQLGTPPNFVKLSDAGIATNFVVSTSGPGSAYYVRAQNTVTVSDKSPIATNQYPAAPFGLRISVNSSAQFP